MAYVSLHTHLETSLLDGASKIADAVAKVAAMGQRALAITDHGRMGGTWKLYQACEKTTAGSTAKASPIDGRALFTFHPHTGYAGQDVQILVDGRRTPTFDLAPGAKGFGTTVAEDLSVTISARTAEPTTARLVFADTDDLVGVKPIMGMEAYLAIGSRFEENSEKLPAGESLDGEKTKRYEHLTLLAATDEGWRNLVAMHNESHNSFWYNPRIDYELMAEHSKGIIALTGCLGGPVLGPLSRAAKLRAEYDPDKADAAWDAADALLPALENAENELRAAFGIDSNEEGQALIDVVRAITAEDSEDRLAETDPALRAVVLAAEDALAAHTAAADIAEHLSTMPDQARALARRAKSDVEKLVDIFGPDNVFIEIMEHEIPGESAALPLVRQLSKITGVPMVVTNDSHYTNAGDAESHDAWLALQTKGASARVDNTDRFRFTGTGYHLRSEDEIRALNDAQWWQDAADLTGQIARRIAADVLPERYMRLPSFPPPPGYDTSLEFFDDLIEAGTYWRRGEDTDEVSEARLRREREVYVGLGIHDYALIVWDSIAWGRSTMSADRWIERMTTGPSVRWDRDEDPTGEHWLATLHALDEGERPAILFGPGRGSAAGSEVSYDLGIVDIDPIRHGLLFERFLDPTRVGMPDVDVDIEKARVNDMRVYAQQRWGSNRVLRIGSFGTSKPRAALKDAARLLGLPTATQDKITKAVPLIAGAFPPVPVLLDDTRAEGVQVRAVLSTLDADVAERLGMFATAFEGTVAREGIHACGVLIGDADMSDIVPSRRDHKKDNPEPLGITLWDGKDVDGFGMLKMDFLGLETLDVLAAALHFASQIEGRELTYRDIPDPDQDLASVRAAFALIARGDTEGIFQLESSGMTELATQVGPTAIDDLSALVALYRPGPMSAGMHAIYADRKNGRQAVDYGIFTRSGAEQQIIESLLGDTFGVITYQEQAMQIGRTIAGFDDAHTNRLRKAVSKKIQAEFDALGIVFADWATRDTTMDGEPKRAFAAATAERLWNGIKGSAQYAFNRSHSAAYGQVAYWTAWVKAAHPAAFGAGMLSVTDKATKRHAILSYLHRTGINVLPPDINSSGVSTRMASESEILLGISEIKGVGNQAAQSIIDYRDKHGPYTSAATLLTEKVVDSGVFVALAEAGALDIFGTRLGLTMASGALRSRPDTSVPGEEYGELGLWKRQHGRLGMTLGRHPMDAYRAQIVDHYDESNSWLKPVPLAAATDHDGRKALVRAMVSEMEIKVLASGNRMVRMTLETQATTCDAIMWENGLARLEEDGHELAAGMIAYFEVIPKVREIVEEIENPDTGEMESVIVSKTELVVNRADPVVIDEQTEPGHYAEVIDILSVAEGALTDPPEDGVARPRPAPQRRRVTRHAKPTNHEAKAAVLAFPNRRRVTNAQLKVARESVGVGALVPMIEEIAARSADYPDGVYVMTSGTTRIEITVGSPDPAGEDGEFGSITAGGVWDLTAHSLARHG